MGLFDSKTDYQRGVEDSKGDGPLAQVASVVGNMFASEEYQRGYEDYNKGKADIVGGNLVKK